MINDLAISPNGFLLASASSDCTMRLWNNTEEAINQNASQVLKFGNSPIKSLDFSCDSKLLVQGSDDKTIKIINIQDKKQVSMLQAHTNWIKCVRFSYDSKIIASCGDDKTVKFFDTNKAECIYTFSNQHGGVVNSVRFHPDNSCIGTACFDKKVRIFDARSKSLVQMYDNHTKPVNSLAFHPCGYFLASTSYDETVKIFDLRKGELLFTLSGHEGTTTAVNFSKFGNYFATGGQDSLVILWKTNLLENDINLMTSKISKTKFTHEDHKQDKMFNGETVINYKKAIPQDTESNQDSLAEDMAKVFEKMVYQLEIVTK